MKIAEMVISAILKKGILYEANNCDVGVDIPAIQKDSEGNTREVKIHVNFKADHMTLRIEKDES